MLVFGDLISCILFIVVIESCASKISCFLSIDPFDEFCELSVVVANEYDDFSVEFRELSVVVGNEYDNSSVEFRELPIDDWDEDTDSFSQSRGTAICGTFA